MYEDVCALKEVSVCMFVCLHAWICLYLFAYLKWSPLQSFSHPGHWRNILPVMVEHSPTCQLLQNYFIPLAISPTLAGVTRVTMPLKLTSHCSLCFLLTEWASGNQQILWFKKRYNLATLLSETEENSKPQPNSNHYVHTFCSTLLLVQLTLKQLCPPF